MSHQLKKNLGVHVHHDGVEFRVWAPFAKAVRLVGTFSTEGPIEMESEEDGYWSCTVKDAEPGQNYKFQIDTGTTTIEKNDPRARVITSSDTGWSVIADTSFDWGDDVFMPIPHNEQIIYEMHIGTFNRPDAATQGTFASAIEKLDYLAELGINMIELMPVTSMAYSHGWGYAPNHIYSVENAYGGRHGLMTFVRECHARGIGVILDVIYNHFYKDTDLWQFDGWSENDKGGIYFYNDYRCDTPWGGRPDYGRPEVRQFILDNVTMWLNEYRLDGLRLDSTIYMRNTEGYPNDPAHDIPEAWSLMGEIATLAHKINPGAIVIAEDFSSTEYITKPVSETGCGFDAQWELNFPHALRNALGLTPNIAPSLAEIHHELMRSYNGDAFEKIIFSDSHDTAANGSVRLNQAVTPTDAGSLFARQKALLANAVTLTAGGIPMLLQGQEFMQEGAFNDWQELQWQKAERYNGIVKAHRDLIDLRLNKLGTTPGLLGQQTDIFHQDDNNNVIGYRRCNPGMDDDTLVIVNFGNQQFVDYRLHLTHEGTWHVRFNSSVKSYSEDFPETHCDSVTTQDYATSIALAPYGVLILSQDE